MELTSVIVDAHILEAAGQISALSAGTVINKQLSALYAAIHETSDDVELARHILPQLEKACTTQRDKEQLRKIRTEIYSPEISRLLVTPRVEWPKQDGSLALSKTQTARLHYQMTGVWDEALDRSCREYLLRPSRLGTEVSLSLIYPKNRLIYP